MQGLVRTRSATTFGEVELDLGAIAKEGTMVLGEVSVGGDARVLFALETFV